MNNIDTIQKHKHKSKINKDLECKCGILAYKSINVPIKIYEFIKRLEKLQNRGRDSCGITYLDNNNNYITFKESGTIQDIFFNINHNEITKEKINNLLNTETKFIIGHLRYATSGNNKNIKDNQDNQDLFNVDNMNNNNYMQPFTNITNKLSIIHNGNIPDKELNKIINKINLKYPNFRNNNTNNIDNTDNTDFFDKINNNNNIHDSKVFFDYLDYHQYIKDKISFDNYIKNTLTLFNGSFNFIVMKDNDLYIIRDKYGYKPLCYGINEDNSILISSESVSFELINNEYETYKTYKYIDNIKTNSVLKLIEPKTSIHKYEFNQLNGSLFSIDKHSYCVFEYIYFMNGLSKINNTITVDDYREKLGIELAKQEKLNFISYFKRNINDIIVIGSPNTGICGGKSYASYLNLPYKQVLIKKPNCGRTFILPDNNIRDKFFKKFVLNTEDIKNKIIIFLDDSIVRGNTIKNMCDLFKENGAKELHIRILSPELKYPCYYGINIPTHEELVMNNYTIEQFEKKCNLNSLRYLNIKSLTKLFGNSMCSACFDGNYNQNIDF